MIAVEQRRQALKYLAGASALGMLGHASVSQATVCNIASSISRFIIKKINNKASVIDIDSDQIIFEHDDASTAINYALEQLTSGRQHNEIISIKGDFDISETIVLSSYTSLVLQGSLTARLPMRNNSKSMLSNRGNITGNSSIEISGGIINCNYTEPFLGTKMDGLHFENCSDLYLHDFCIQNANNEGIEILNTSNFWLEHIKIENSGDDGISILQNSRNGMITKCTCCNCQGVTGGSSGIEIEDGSHKIIIAENISFGHNMNVRGYGGSGISVITDSISSYNSCNQVVIVNNIVRDNQGSGISFQSQVDSLSCDILVSGNILDSNRIGIAAYNSTDSCVQNNLITNSNLYGITINNTKNSIIDANQVHNSGYSGIRLYNSSNNLIHNNISINNSQENTWSAGIGLITGSNDNIVQGNDFSDYQDYPTQEFGIYESKSGHNYYLYNKTTGTNRPGESIKFSNPYENSKISNNIGFTTESSGTVILPSSRIYVSVHHGLDTKPGIEQIMVTPNSTLGEATQFYINDPNGYRFRIYVDKPPQQDIEFSWAIQ